MRSKHVKPGGFALEKLRKFEQTEGSYDKNYIQKKNIKQCVLNKSRNTVMNLVQIAVEACEGLGD